MQKKVRKLSHQLLPVVFDGHKEETACADFELGLDHPRDGPGIALHLWVYFSTTLVEINFVKMKIGVLALTVKRCRLCLDLTNATISLKDRGLKAAMPLKTVRTIETSQSHSDSAARGADLKASAKLSAEGPTVSGGFQSSQSWKTKDENALKYQYSFVAAQVQAGGTATKPCWDFCDESGGGSLLGGIENKCLGKLTLSGGPCEIRGTIEVFPRDIVLEGRSGIFPTSLNENDRIVRILLFLNFLDEYVHPYLCERRYEVINDP
jgi:hypothetical protein